MSLKEKIVCESLKLFSLKGFLNTSINDILEVTGASKGGFYNHFKSKEDLFLAVLSEARKIWRARNLDGLDTIDDPIDKLVRLLENYRDRYLKYSENLPGGCVFVVLSVELADQLPHLAGELNEGFIRLKAMIKRLLDEGSRAGHLRGEVAVEAVTDVIFSGMIGASVTYGIDKSVANVDHTIASLIVFLRGIRG